MEIHTAPVISRASTHRRQDRRGGRRSGPPDPIRIVLLPGFEYRMLEWRYPTTHEIHWRLERRKSAQYSEDDE